MRNLRHASLALSLAAGISACAPSFATSATKAAAFSTEQPAVSSLSSEWSGGRCFFDDKMNALGYSSRSGAAKLKLDYNVKKPDRLLCSDDYSVIFDSDKAVVSMGAEGILSGREFIGQYGGRFTLANSYFIDIAEIRGEGIAKARIISSTLVVETEKGKRWSIELSDPQDWTISAPEQGWNDAYSPSGRILYYSH